MTNSCLYLESGYLNFDYILAKKAAFNIIIGGRGIGKTYGCLSYFLKAGQPFLLLRRTQTQCDIVSNPLFNPLKGVADDAGIEIQIKPIPKTKSTQTLSADGELLSVNAALSTFANLRGWDGRAIKSIVYDEFIPSPGERTIKDEGLALLHCYETISRNREIQSGEVLPLFLLANAFDTAADTLRVLGVAEAIEKMYRKHQEEKIIRRGSHLIYIVLPKSPISAAKAGTALYDVANDDFKKLSLENTDIHITDRRKHVILTEYTLKCTTDDFEVYRHKSRSEYFIKAYAGSKCPNHYTRDPRGRRNFARSKKRYLDMYIKGKVFFDANLTERIFIEWYT